MQAIALEVCCEGEDACRHYFFAISRLSALWKSLALVAMFNKGVENHNNAFFFVSY